jgi:hypothetical protein
VAQLDSLEQLLQFLSKLQDAKIQFDLKCIRDAIMVALKGPGAYYEIEFFPDGHIEVQTYGMPSQVHTVTLQEITDIVIREVNG